MILDRGMELGFPGSQATAVSIASYRKEKREGAKPFSQKKSTAHYLKMVCLVLCSSRPQWDQNCGRRWLGQVSHHLILQRLRFFFFQTWKFGIIMKSYNEEVSKQLLIYPTKHFTCDEIGILVSRTPHRVESRCNHRMCDRVRANSDFGKKKIMWV